MLSFQIVPGAPHERTPLPWPSLARTTAKDYEEAIRKVWGSNADAAPLPISAHLGRSSTHRPIAAEVLLQYPLSRFEVSPQKAFLQVDADSNVICPSYQLIACLGNVKITKRNLFLYE